jgi:trafficking protein particle complex subunit 8
LHRTEVSETDADPTPYLFESDISAMRALVRELTVQSVIPSMERSLSSWNESVLSRRRGISGRFMSLSKRWTPFGGGSSRNSSGPLAGLQASGGGSSGNYDSLQGFYRPESPEATMRKLADYAVMLRDFKLAASTYDLLRADFNADKAWRYYAGANEMAAVATLLDAHTRSGAEKSTSTKSRLESLDGWLETASYSYVTRCIAPYYALRTLVMGSELLKMRGTISSGDEAAKWGCKVLELGLAGPLGSPLFMERISMSYGSKISRGELRWGGRRRKAAFWAVMAVENWLKMDKVIQAGKMLERAGDLYGITDAGAVAVKEGEQKGAAAEKAKPKALKFSEMKDFIEVLREAVVARKLSAHGFDGEEAQDEDEVTLVEEVSEKLDTRPHRKSLIGAAAPALGDMDVAPLSPLRTRDDEPAFFKDDSFE